MEKTFEQHRRQLIKEALEYWDERGEVREIEKDPVMKLLFTALAYQSHSISREISNFQEKTVNELRNKLIPYHLIKPFPALSILQTKIGKNKNDSIESLPSFIVDEKTVFKFGKNKMQFSPLFETKIVNAEIAKKQIDESDYTIRLELSSEVTVDDFSGMSFYFEDIKSAPDIKISLNDQFLPLIRPDDYDNLPFTDWFRHHYLLREENQLQMGSYDYWQEFYIKQQVHLYYINKYNTSKIRNISNSPVFKIHFKNISDFQYFHDCNIKINCLPIINVQKMSITLSNNEPIKKLTAEKSVFLSLLVDENTDDKDDNYYIRHFGVERFNRDELLFQINDLFNRFISDYYAFKDIFELKKGEKLENLYNSFKEILPTIIKNDNSNYSGVYAILKLNKNLKFRNEELSIDYLVTNCELANGIREGENPDLTSEFLSKEGTVLLKETSGGRGEDVNEESLNHLARYNILAKDKIVTSSDLIAFCYKELKNKIQNVTVNNTGRKVDVVIQMKNDYFPDEQEKQYYESLLQQKIKVRSIFSLPVNVIIDR